jgi:flavin-dependent dehydrogenase
MTKRTSHHQEIDLAIIGAGPAGLSTALHLLQLDPQWSHRLIILEKERHPREKLCGGGITCFGLDRLQSLDLYLGIPFIPITTVNLSYRDRSVKIQGDPVFVVTRRSEFDDWLADCARARGANLIENAEVTQLERCSNGIKIGTVNATYLAKAVVGADGSRGLVRRWLGARERPAHVARVIECLGSASGHEKPFEDSEASFVFDQINSHLQGYFWVFPSLINGQPNLNCGVYDARIDSTQPKADLMRIMDQGLGEIEIDVGRIKVKGHPIRWFSPWNQISDHGVILVGDAAGTDPLFGEGISVSLAYGAVAARELEEAFYNRDFRFNRYKKSVLTSDVGQYLLLRWFLASMMSRFQRSELLIRTVCSIGQLLARFIHPGAPLPEVCPLPFAPIEQVSEVVGDY